MMDRQKEFESAQAALQKAKDLNKTESKPSKSGNVLGAFGNITNAGQLGVGMFVCILMGFLLGLWLDKIAGTGYLLLFVFTVLGIASAFKQLFDYAKKG